MAEGVRANMEAAVAAGFRHLLFRPAGPEDLLAVEAYVRAMAPPANPFLVNGRLSAKARRGKTIFDSPRARCATCHRGPLLTDLKTYNVGTRGPTDWQDRYDTPTLVEVWRTAPYLHDDRACTLRDVLTTFNRNDRHGRTSHLSAAQVDALAAYLLSL